MTYAEALAYLDSFINLERKGLDREARAVITLDNVRLLAARLGNPERQFRSLHVAGTKGKGSTCAFAASMLQAAGLKTGLYVSPHLQDLRERISINGAQIPEADFARILTLAQPVLEEMRRRPVSERKPTYFEVLTHVAFTWFAEQRVDIAVVEVGLGGRLDATNIITPVACAITNISYDHMAVLGDTLELIAAEKAGIFKPNVPAVIAPQRPEVAATLRAAAQQAGAPCEWLGENLAVKPLPATRSGVWPPMHAEATLPTGRRVQAELGLRGAHQLENWTIAVRLAELAHQTIRGAALPERAIAEGSQNVRWPGRLEELPARNGVRIIVDGAHNDYSLKLVLNELKTNVPAPHALVFGCAKDKDWQSMLREIKAAHFDAVVFTQAASQRSKNAAELAADWQQLTNLPGEYFETAAEAVNVAAQRCGGKGVVLITGSLYLAGEVRALAVNPQSAIRNPQ